METGIVDVEGAQLAYRIEGHGETCLVLGSSVFYPRAFSEDLREHLQLVFVDLRHFAPSDRAFGPERISIETYSDDIEQVRQILALDDVVMIGTSIHGTIALEYARRHPEHVRGVVAVGAPSYRSDEAESQRERFWEADASDARKEILARQLAELTPESLATLSPADTFVRNYVANGPKCWYDAAYDCSWMWDEVEPNMPLISRVYNELFRPYDLAEVPGEIAVPALVVHGRYDYLVPHTFWDERLHKLPRHTYVLLERSGHTPPHEEPERFDQVLLDWVRGL